MNEMYIVSFNSTHHAIRLDKLLGEASVRATTLPTPRADKADRRIYGRKKL